MSIWDFSGYEPYFMLYDHFIGDPNAIHVVTFSLAEAPATQLAQVLFWMNFLKARIPTFEPIGMSLVHHVFFLLYFSAPKQKQFFLFAKFESFCDTGTLIKT